MNIAEKYPGSKLVSLTGPQVSGKGSASAELAKHGFMHISTGDVLRAEADKMGMSHDRAVLSDIAQGLHRKYKTFGALVIKGIESWEDRSEEFPSGLVLDGLRVPAECQVLKQAQGVLGYIDAPIEARYDWALRRNRSGEAVHTFEEFRADDVREFEGDGDEGRPCLKVVRSMADFVIDNTGTPEDLHAEVVRNLSLGT